MIEIAVSLAVEQSVPAHLNNWILGMVVATLLIIMVVNAVILGSGGTLNLSPTSALGQAALQFGHLSVTNKESKFIVTLPVPVLLKASAVALIKYGLAGMAGLGGTALDTTLYVFFAGSSL
jgi:hypothetical protein